MQLMTSLPVLAFGPGHAWGHGGWWWLWGPAFLGFWFLVVGAIAVTIWTLGRRGAMHRPVETTEQAGVNRARAILAERFARGEISAEEYDERLTHLN